MVFPNKVIEVRNLGKQYRIPLVREEQGHKRGAVCFPRRRKTQLVWAIRNIDIDIMRGSIVAIMGDNGSGKSTLLRLISEISDPSEGEIILRGTIAPMLEAGVGFHPELTGRENIYLNATLMGISRKDLALRFDEIVNFADIKGYLDTPMKRYSSGMFTRLAFAVATHQNRDILIVDEVLSINDVGFREKSIRRLKHLAENGVTILLVSHDVELLNSLCNHAILLQNGRLIAQGSYQEVRALYYNSDMKFNSSKLQE